MELSARITRIKSQDPFNDPDHANDNAAVDTDVREQMGHETVEAEIAAMKKKVAKVMYAYKKIEKGSYGTCESCKKEIPLERLELVPEAQYCIDCERRLIK